jgi:hypothetical protein
MAGPPLPELPGPAPAEPDAGWPVVDPAGGRAIVNAVTWSPLPTNSSPPPALGLAKWLTSDPFSGIENWLLAAPELRSRA